jgi:hypothetical protein
MIRVGLIAVIGAMIQLVCSTVQAQGVATVIFSNDRPFSTPADRLVRDDSGIPLVGTNYLAQLYYGPDRASPASLNPVSNAPAPFRDPTHSSPGTWEGGGRTLSGFTSGDYITLQVRVWDGTVASTYEDAAALGFLDTQHGVSQPFTYLAPAISAPSWFWYIEEFRGFTLVPEPSVALLGIIGIVGLYFWRSEVLPKNRTSGGCTVPAFTTKRCRRVRRIFC